MRASSWLYQYSSQTKFTYGLCPGGQGRGGLYPSTGTAGNQQQDYVRAAYPHDPDAQHSPSLRADRTDAESHGSTKTTQAMDYPSRRLLLRDDAEPVDMSISGVEQQHEGSRAVHSAAVHRQQQQQQQQQQHTLDDPVRYHKQYHKSSLHLAGYRAKFVQCHGQYASSADMLSPGNKYYLTDLDRDYCCPERSGLLLHKRLSTKTLIAPSPSGPQGTTAAAAAAAAGSTAEPPESATLESWGASPAWSDALQRVPDVVHQELSPYITTPTTPVNTPDSELHSDAPIFNFDWAGEQHVPNLKITFRSTAAAAAAAAAAATAGHPAQTRKHQDVQPITLQLPRRKGQSADDGKDFAK